MKNFDLRIAPALILAGSALLSGCMAPPEAAPPEAKLAATDACGSNQYASVKGMTQSDLASAGFSDGPKLLIIAPGKSVPTDYNPERVTINVGPAGTVTNVYCG
ncbi:MAG: I78 family peptidase inhibitor [Maritimibacter sp.]